MQAQNEASAARQQLLWQTEFSQMLAQSEKAQTLSAQKWTTGLVNDRLRTVEVGLRKLNNETTRGLKSISDIIHVPNFIGDSNSHYDTFHSFVRQ